MIQFGRWVRVGLCVASACVLMCSCAGGAEQLRAGRTSAHIVLQPGSTFPLNFVFVSGANHRVFTEFDGIRVEGLGEFGPDDAELVRGDTRDGLAIATIAVPVEVEEPVIEFQSILVRYSDGAEEAVDVGEWVIEASEATSALEPTPEWPAVMPACTQFESAIRASELPPGPVSVRADQPGLSLAGIATVEADGRFMGEFDPRCSSDFDMYVMTIEVAPEGDESAVQYLDPVMIGYMDISDETVQRIAQR